MGRLGVSIYPEHSTPEKDMAYLTLAAKYGFSRVFTCLLSVNKPAEEIKADFKQVCEHANNLGMEVIVDVAPRVFTALGITYDNLSFFKEIGASGFRLDEGFNGGVEANMTYNPHGLKVEINASSDSPYIDLVMFHKPARSKLIACHNFYPQTFSGLDLPLFKAASKKLRGYNIPIAAFVGSQEEGTYGPWPVNEGLCTLEAHRTMPIDAQARHLFATGLVDDVIIANAYASEEELKALSEVDRDMLTFGVELEPTVSEIEKEIIFEFKHHVRADMPKFMARSTMCRLAYANADIPATNTRDLKRGDIIVVNNEYGHYKGELHIILEDMPNDGRKNVVGHIPEYEHVMLEYVVPNAKFAFTTVKK